MARSGVDDKAGWLVDDEDIAVLIEDIEIDGLRLDFQGLWRRNDDFVTLPLSRPVTGLGLAAGPKGTDLPHLDQFFCETARHPQRYGKEEIKTLPCRVVAYTKDLGESRGLVGDAVVVTKAVVSHGGTSKTGRTEALI